MYKSVKIRLELSNVQASKCLQHAGTARHAYNYFVNFCREKYSAGEKIPSAIDMHKILVAFVKKECPWYYESSKCAPQQALRNLETAYKNFHRIQKPSGYKLLNYKMVGGVRKSIGLAGLPQFKQRGFKDSFFLEGAIQVLGNKIKVPKLGWLTCSEMLPDVPIKNVTISRTANDWYIAFKYEFVPEHTKKNQDTVGVDLGIKTLATLSNGETFTNLKPYKNAKLKLRKAQKELSRRHVKGAKSQSSNYAKSRMKVAKIHQTVANIRKDGLHKLTTYLAKNFETVCIEDLNVSGMSKNHKLASAILDGGFFEFKRQLLYKKEWYGGTLVLANTFFPSSKLCSHCGERKKTLKLSERSYNCESCGAIEDRDSNASLNLNNLAVSSTVTAFGDESSAKTKVSAQFVDELGIKHQMFTFV